MLVSVLIISPRTAFRPGPQTPKTSGDISQIYYLYRLHRNTESLLSPPKASLLGDSPMALVLKDKEDMVGERANETATTLYLRLFLSVDTQARRVHYFSTPVRRSGFFLVLTLFVFPGAP